MWEGWKMLFLSSPLGGTFGPSIRQGVAEANFPFSGSEKLPLDTEIGDALILVVLGTEKGAKHKANAHPQTFLLSSVTSVTIKTLGWRDPIACPCSVQDLIFPSLMWRPGWFSPILVILTPIISFSCYLLLLLASQSSSLESSWCCSKTQYCRGPFWLHFIFRWPALVLFSVFLQQAESRWFSDGRSLDREMGERNIKTINFTYWNAWPRDTWSCGLSSLKVDAGLSRASAAHRHSCVLQGRTARWVMSGFMTKLDT